MSESRPDTSNEQLLKLAHLMRDLAAEGVRPDEWMLQEWEKKLYEAINTSAVPSIAAQPVAYMEYDNNGTCLGPTMEQDGFWKDTRPLYEHPAPLSHVAPFCYRLTVKANGARIWQDKAPDAWDIKNCDIVPLYEAPVSAIEPPSYKAWLAAVAPTGVVGVLTETQIQRFFLRWYGSLGSPQETDLRVMLAADPSANVDGSAKEG